MGCCNGFGFGGGGNGGGSPSIWLPAVDWSPTTFFGTRPAPTIQNVEIAPDGSSSQQVLTYIGGLEQAIFSNIGFSSPPNWNLGPIRIRLYWFHTNGAVAAQLRWILFGIHMKTGEAFDITNTNTGVMQTTDLGANLLQLAPVIDFTLVPPPGGGAAALGDFIFLQLARSTVNGTVNDVHMIGMEVIFNLP